MGLLKYNFLTCKIKAFDLIVMEDSFGLAFASPTFCVQEESYYYESKGVWDSFSSLDVCLSLYRGTEMCVIGDSPWDWDSGGCDGQVVAQKAIAAAMAEWMWSLVI